MRMIYLDSDYKCHLYGDETMTLTETDFFDDKCETFIEGYRFVPQGEIWTREDGEEFEGIIIAPWKPYEELDVAQREYEKEQFTETQSALAILLGEV